MTLLFIFVGNEAGMSACTFDECRERRNPRCLQRGFRF